MGDTLTLRPVMRTHDGNGWRVALTVQGPELSSCRLFASRPSPLGGDNWIFGDHLVHLKQSGDYTIDITGTTLWPFKTFAVRYHLFVQSDNL